MRTRRILCRVAFLSICLLATTQLIAQKYTGTITGVVTDPQGAVVSGAQVTITNQGTGNARSVTTGGSGVYSVPDLDVGKYEVRVRAANFKEFVSRDLELDTASTATVNASLQIGDTTEKVTVEASTVHVETSTGAVGNVVEGNEVRELPLNGNNFVELTQLMPGVSPLSQFNTVKKGLEGGVDFSVNGNNNTGNLFLVDGVNNNDVGSNRTILIYPSLQAIDEFKILRNSYGPEYGQAAGAVISIVTRGGTNSFHGGVFYDGRNTALNAADYFNNLHGIPKDVIKRNDYGFNVGGPIIKDKLFFFESEEWNREERGASRTGIVPTVAEKSGDFSGASGCEPTPSSGYTNNIIPAGNLSRAGFLMVQGYPSPNLSNVVNCANWGASFGAKVPWREDNVRIDFHPSSAWAVMGRFTNDSWSQPYPSTLSYWGDDIFPSVEGGWTQPSKQATIKLTRLIGATAVNDFQVSFAANAIDINRSGTGVDIPANPFGIPTGHMSPDQYERALNAATLPYFPVGGKALGLNMGQPLFWNNGIVGASAVSGGSGGLITSGPWHNNEQLLILKDDFNKVLGAHTFKVGFIATNNQKNQRNAIASGENGAYWATQAENWGGTAPSGNGVFDMLNAGTEWGWGEASTNPFMMMRWHDYEFYGGDNWKVRPNITLEYGLRWSFLPNAFNANGQFAWWDPKVFNPALGSSPCNGMLTTHVGIADCQALGLPGAALGSSNSLVPNNNHAIQPRIGIAWDPQGNGKTSIRSGFGMYYQRFFLNTAMSAPANAPFVFNNPSAVSQRTLDVSPSASTGVLFQGSPHIGIAQNNDIPYTLQYNLTVERELTSNTKLEVAYVANRAKHLEETIDANYVVPGNRVAYANCAQTNTNCPFASNANTGYRLYGKTTGWGQIPFAMFEGHSNYDALQALFRTRLKAVDAQFAYTWSKSLANVDLSDSGGSTSASNTVLDPFRPNGDYGPSIINRPQILVGNITYNAPQLNGHNGFLRTAFGSWELSSILNYLSGPSLTVYAGSTGAANGLVGSGFTNSERPNRVPGQSCRASSSDPTLWLNPGAWTLDHYAIGAQYPTSTRGVCEGPGIADTDFSIRKNFKLTERVTAKFSMDFFNLFNKTQFRADSINGNFSNTGSDCFQNTTNVADPGYGNSINNPAGPCFGYAQNTLAWNSKVSSNLVQQSFGRVGTDRGPREIQYGLKVEF